MHNNKEKTYPLKDHNRYNKTKIKVKKFQLSHNNNNSSNSQPNRIIKAWVKIIFNSKYNNNNKKELNKKAKDSSK